MATYDLTSGIPGSVKTGDILNCPYSGTYKTIQLPIGQYKIECWGASGGNTTYGGKGAYATGIITTTAKTPIYIYAGGQGTQGNTSSTVSGGFNGGGNCPNSTGNWYSPYPQSGGGGSDVRIGQNSLYARAIVAGGGGGSSGISGSTGTGGAAGGSGSASDGTLWCCGPVGRAASQTAGGAASGTNSNGIYSGAAGSFGAGGSGSPCGSYNAGSGGGGGWYGGGGSSGGCGGSGGGGGSSYVYNASTAANYPSGCLLNSANYLASTQLVAGTSSFTSPTGTTETGHTGNGYVRITVLNALAFDPEPNLTTSFTGYNVQLTWATPSADGVSLGYPTQLYRNGVLLSSNLTSNSFTDANISLNQAYTYKLRWNNNDDYITEMAVSTPGNLESTTNFNYEGAIKTFNFLAGKKYKLEAWGAEGGSTYYSSAAYTVYGGKGGYSVAEYTPETPTTGYIVVGQQPPSMYSGQSSPNAGGYNGGGSGAHAGGGGGASHIALTAGLLSALSGSIANILLVAGAGGGASMYPTSNINSYNWGLGGVGGGSTGGDGKWVTNWWNNSSYYGRGGTQSAGGGNGATASPAYGMGSFGLGGTYTGNSYTGGGGAGFYGGGSGYSNGDGGGGGSGYIGALTANGATLRGDAVFKSPAGTNVTGNSGNGYVRISTYGTDKYFTGGLTVTDEHYRIKLTWNSIVPGQKPTILRSTDGINYIALSATAFLNGEYTQYEDLTATLGNTYYYQIKYVYNGEDVFSEVVSIVLVATPPVFNFSYTGGVQNIQLPKGDYQLECWGARGGNQYWSYQAYGGNGGYAKGNLSLAATETLYIYAGGQGQDQPNSNSMYPAGGWNGGGQGYDGGGGGGGTDIRRGGQSIANRIIVAGGGGGANAVGGSYGQANGGVGGGATGGTGGITSNWTTGYYSTGGTQSAYGTANSGWNGAHTDQSYGANYYNRYCAGGGGGYWGGNCGAYNGGAGSGGSGYTGTLTNAQNIAGNASMPAPTGGTETGHASTGYVRITDVTPISPDKWYTSGIAISYKYYKLRMTWNALVAGQKVVVYRSVNGGTYEVVNTDGLVSPYGYTVFEDKNITAGNTYSYKMKYIYQGYDVYTEVTSYTISVTPSINNFSYTGAVQSITLPKGQYKLEAWGAKGGGGNGVTTTNLGGYSTGVLDLQTQQTVYVYVGQQGDASTNNPSRTFGGGGSCYSSNGRSMGRGGGASDIRIGTDSLYARVIVAGGGGGADYNNSYPGGAGGGTSGIAGGYANCGGTGGTPTAGGSAIGNTTSWGGTWYSGSFGLGGYGVNGGYMNGGGGGWYGGGASGPDGTSGGGSGYVYTSATASQYPSGVLLNSTHYLSSASTAAGNTTFVAPGGGTETGHNGHGYVRITSLSSPTEMVYANNFSLTNSGKKVDLAWDDTRVNGEFCCDKLNIYKDDVLLYTSTALDPNTANISFYSDTAVSFNTSYTYKIEWIIAGITYYTSSTIFARDIKVGDGNFTVLVKEFNYNGGEQTTALELGKKYKLETWGAQGGQGYQNASYPGIGGLGGYSMGYYQPLVNETLYANVGGQGASDNAINTSVAGGYNGGGTGVNFAGGGGGATHFATVSGLLNTLSGQIPKILLVAAGGGGGQSYQSSPAAGGYGGGTTGGYGSYSGYWGSSSSYRGYPGTPSAAGSNPSGWNNGTATFGHGGNYYSSYCGGGGSGFYGGACGGYNGSGGGGGSSYIGASVTSGITTANQRSGNGYARVYTETVVTVDYVKTTFDFNLSSSVDLNDRLTLTWNAMTNVASYLLYKDSQLYGSYTENTMSLLVPPDQSSTYEIFAILNNGDVYTSGVKTFAGNSSAAVNIEYFRIIQDVMLLDSQEQGKIILNYGDNSIIKTLLTNTTINPYKKVKVIFSWRPTESVTGRTLFADEEISHIYNVVGDYTQASATYLFDLLRNYSYTFTIKIQTYSSYSSAYRTYCSYTTNTLTPEASTFNITSVIDPDCSFKKGTIIANVGDGGISKVLLPPGQYMVEAYGADGGTGYQNASYKGTGGKGAYNKYILTLNSIEKVYLAAGLRGADNMTDSISKGGFNGGGDGYQYCGAGGGCTSLSTVEKQAKDCNSVGRDIISIAGGAGGGIGYSTATPGVGGSSAQDGSNGTYCTNWSNSTMIGKGGTQSAGGINPGSNNVLYNGGFGYGGRYYTSYCAGGGAGWYGGSSGGANGCAGGGGASNVNTGSFSISDIAYNNKATVSNRDADGAIFITRLSTPQTLDDSFAIDEDYESDIIMLSFVIPANTLSYAIYRKDANGGEEFLDSDSFSVDSTGLQILYKDEKFKYNKDYCYQIRYYSDTSSTNLIGMSKIINIITPESIYTIYTSTNIDDIIMHSGTILKYPFEKAPRLTKLPAGTYNLTVKGAQGGSYSSGIGGLGGYSYGTIDLTKTESFYIYTGEQGKGGATSALEGGWNGGGASYTASSSYYEGSGGGATDIRINSTSLYARVLVAGGGGGHGEYSGNWLAGGAGGGQSAMNGAGYNASYLGGLGGSQTGGGNSYYQTTVNSTTYGSLAEFGIGGGSTTTSYQISGGGGGWYGGGYSFRSAAGGGSGYYYNASTAANYPSGCLLDSRYYLKYSGTNANMNAGNGYCEIECETLLNFDQALNLQSSLDEDSNITLTWDNITYNALLPISFKLDKANVTKTTANTNTFTDTDIDWNKSYKYTLTFTFVDGTEISRSIRVNSLPSYYDLTSGTTKVIEARRNTIINCGFMDVPRQIILPPGLYKMQCWGAEGGSYIASAPAGKGGYSTGTIELLETAKFFLYTGGQGNYTSGSSIIPVGGYNGGGSSYLRYSGSGGGASDIRIGENSLYARVLVAGGGGGSGYYNGSYYGYGGNAGGSTGSPGNNMYQGGSTAVTFGAGQGGTQTVGGEGGYYSTTTYKGGNGAFGLGGNVPTQYTTAASAGGGGGGWYGGGSGGGHNDASYYYYSSVGGGGGSGYYYAFGTTKDYPTGGLLNRNYCLSDAVALGGGSTFVSPTGANETGHPGNGYIIITCIRPLEILTLDNQPNLRGVHYKSKNLIKWDRVLVDGNPMSYKLYRENLLIYEGTEVSFKDIGIDDVTPYGYVLVIQYEGKTFKTNIVIDPTTGYTYKDTFKGFYFKLNGQWYVWENE